MMPLRISRRTLIAAGLAIAMAAAAAQTPANRAKSASRGTAPTARNVAPKADAAQQHFDSAQTYQLAGDFDRASKEYRQAIAIGLPSR